MRSIVMSTLQEDALADLENKLDEMGVNIIEERYDLLRRKYEVYVKANFWQSSKLRYLVKSHGKIVIEFES